MTRALLDKASGTNEALSVRLKCRSDSLTGPTAGLAMGRVQGNLAILPREYAFDFLRFCQANPKPCPLIGVGEVGERTIPALGDDLDIYTDLPQYRVWQNGEPAAEVANASAWWREDLVPFVLGCSLSFEEALLAEGIRIRHVETGGAVPMYRTSINCVPAGRFFGPLVVSMRPMPPEQAIRAIQITSRFPSVHGAPVHIGFPDRIGIEDISKPDYGDTVEIRDGEIPVFWACGVTPQAAIAAVEPSFAITHSPGCMLVTDLRNTALAIL